MNTLGLVLGRVLWSTLEYWARNLDLDLKAVDLHGTFGMVARLSNNIAGSAGQVFHK